MTLYMNHKADQVPPRTIIVGVTLGLFSLVAVASGQGIKDEYVWQTKSEVLTEGFFK